MFAKLKLELKFKNNSYLLIPEDTTRLHQSRQSARKHLPRQNGYVVRFITYKAVVCTCIRKYVRTHALNFQRA